MHGSKVKFLPLKFVTLKKLHEYIFFPQNRYWFPFTTAEYGNCFSFNSHYNKDVDKLVPRKSTLTGSLYGK